MTSTFFWTEWVREYRYAWYAGAFLFLISLIFLWYGYFRGADAVTDWHTLQEQKILDVTVHTFQLGPFTIDVPAESYVIFEHFNGGQIQPDKISSYFYLVIFALSCIMLVSVITTLEKFWYFFAMTGFILLLISLRFEILELFGSRHLIVSAIVIAFYAVPSFYFNMVRSSTPFVIRIATFSAVTLLLILVIWFFSHTDYPFYHLAVTSFTSTLIISLLFIVLVAHEIIAGFVYLVSQGSGRSLAHLLIISVIYLANVFLTAFNELGVINWNFLYINAYLLLTLSAVIGIWGYRNREPIYQNIFPFYPFGALIFLAMGAICFATTGHLMINVHDSALRIISDGTIFMHAGYGLIFVLYLISNFGELLTRNHAAYKVLYDPRRMPYFSYRFAGMVASLAFVFYGNWRSYIYMAIATMNNLSGDLHTALGNRPFAESMYFQGYRQTLKNYRSNYMMAQLKASRFSIKDAHQHYKLSNEAGATEYSLVNAGNIHYWTSDYFPAARQYKQGLQAMPGSARLANNTALSYARVHNVDSAIYFLERARNDRNIRNSAEMNFFALAATEIVPIKVDSVLNSFQDPFPGTVSNALALSTVLGSPFRYDVQPLRDKKLNLYTATLLNNYIIQQARDVDSVFINEAYRVASDPENEPYSEALKSSLAFAYYHEGNVARALEILAEQVFLSQSYQGKFNYIMGLFALEQNNPELASTFFTYADTYDFKDARFYNAIALTESGRTTAALAAWDSVKVYGDDSQREIANRIGKILTIPATQAPALSEAERYQFCRYRIGYADSILFNRIVATFTNENYKAKALLDLSRNYFEGGYIIPAIRYYTQISGLRLTDRNLYDQVRHFELRMLASRGEVRELARQINNEITFKPEQNLEKIFYTALISEASGDTITAEKNYAILARYNPYFEEGIIAAYNFYKKKSGDKFYAYNILAEAIQINSNSLRLLRVYHDEALAVGLSEYAVSAAERIREVRALSR